MGEELSVSHGAAEQSYPPDPDLRARVLMVDDHPPNLIALEAILSPLGQELVRATSGQEALRQLLDGDFAVILMDVQMPGIDGMQTAKLIKERPRNRHIPIIFLTAISKDAAHIFRGYQEGAVDYLLKPFDPEILRAKVSVFVDLWRKGEQIKQQAAMLRAQELIQLERKSETRFRALTDSMPQCVWAARKDGEVYYCNRVWKEFAGPDAGMSFTDAAPEDEVEEIRNAWREAVRGGPSLDREQRLRRHDGQYRWHLCRVVPERDEHGAVVGWIATATDIDQQKRIEQSNASLLTSEKEARQSAEIANRSKDEFLATVSHELRTPLNAILGWTRMLRTGAVEEKALGRALETIERNARVQTQLIEDILDVSRIIAGKLRVDIRRIDLHTVTRAAIEAVQPSADAKGVELLPNFSPDSAEFAGDPDRLQQVIWNLIANSIKFTPKGGRVQIDLSRENSQVQLVVSDTGLGIAKDFLPHVFDRFRQADSSITRTQGGLGLGLAIVRHLVDAHDGTVEAHSDGPGTGTCMTVRLPVRVVAPAEAPDVAQVSGESPEESAPAAQLLAGLGVLVVDDEADARELLTAVLASYGAVVRTAASVEEALRHLEEQVPDVLVSDIGLPNQDGYALIRRVRELGAGAGGNVPAAALTAYASTEDHKRALSAGFQVHLTKPIEPSNLARVVASLAGRTNPEPGPALHSSTGLPRRLAAN